MARSIKFILTLLICNALNAQIHEIGITAGTTNFVGDVGNTYFLVPTDFGYGLFYRWNKSARHSYRASLNKLKISGKDKNDSSLLRKERGLSFDNNITELSLGLEFNYLEFDLHNQWFSFTPYTYTGIVAMQYDEKHFDNFKNLITTDKKYSWAIPFSIGIKALVDKKLVVSAESGFRYSFTDNLDGNYPESYNFRKNIFGNINSNDWYFFTGISVSYTFGSNPCFCRE